MGNGDGDNEASELVWPWSWRMLGTGGHQALKHNSEKCASFWDGRSICS